MAKTYYFTLVLSLLGILLTRVQGIHKFYKFSLLDRSSDVEEDSNSSSTSTTTVTSLGPNNLGENKLLPFRIRDTENECPPPFLRYGYVSPIRSKYQSGDRITVICQNGYSLENEETGTLFCNARGNWQVQLESGRLSSLPLPRCTARESKSCVLPLPPSAGKVQEYNENGQTNQGNRRIISALYECNVGYKLHPPESNIRHCVNGEWTGIPPKCIQTGGCGRPAIPVGTHYTVAGYTLTQMSTLFPVGFALRFYCDVGFELSDFPLMYCTASGEWHPRKPPTCLPLTRNSTHSRTGTAGWCPSLGLLKYTEVYQVRGKLTPRGAPDDSLVKLTCIAGYNNVNLNPPCSSSYLKCNNGNWQGQRPLCEPVQGCTQPPVINNGQVQVLLSRNIKSSLVPVYSNAIYRCHPGYTLEGTPTATCQNNGCWHPMVVPKCVLASSYYAVNSDEEVGRNRSRMLLTVVTTCTVLFTLSFVWMVIAYRARSRRRARYAHPPTSACPTSSQNALLESPRNFPWNLVHWPRSSSPGNNATIPEDVTGGPMVVPPNHGDVDRVALIACIDGVQVVLPTYEEATRDVWPVAPPPYESIVGSGEMNPLEGSLAASHNTRNRNVTSNSVLNSPSPLPQSANINAPFGEGTSSSL